MEKGLELPLYAYSRARSASFTLEYLLLQSLSYLVPSALTGGKPKPAKNENLPVNWERTHRVRRDLADFLRQDSLKIAQGVYPLSVLYPESPIRHLKRIPQLVADGFAIHRRRMHGRTTEFDPRAREWLEGLPKYYRRNFHFQSSGYLSRRSAEVYEHQVELLFQGSADAMRRLILPPLRKRFGNTDGEGLRFLEIGAGTGRATRFVHLAFPKARIVAVDLSDPYLHVARKNLAGLSRIDLLQADGARLPFRDSEFDAVFSVFLFHELPRQARVEVLTESHRVLKKNGFIGFVDSLQTGDKALFDPLLEEFPKQFHEPFFRDYISNPMEGLLKKCKFGALQSATGFSSKVCSAKRISRSTA